MTEQMLPVSAYTFNLWDEPWIRVTDKSGHTIEASIDTCLREAPALYALHDPSPLVVAGTHRLLTAIVQAIYQPDSLGAIEAILETGYFDLARLDAFAAQYRARFDLFHPTAPFLQTGDVSLGANAVKDSSKPIASLFNEIPGSTYRAHFHHVTDDMHQVCPACCARGLLTIPSFASSGGAGIYPSINGVPPIYVFPSGDTLLQTLALSLTTPDYQPTAAAPERTEDAVWTRDTPIPRNHEVSAVGYLESLTFPARRMRLFPQSATTGCTQCGTRSSIVVHNVIFEMGHRRSKSAPTWDDPFVAFLPPPSRSKREQTGPVPVRPQPGKALWREYSTLLLSRAEETEHQPKIVRQLGHLHGRGVLADTQLVRFRCIGLRTDGKGKFFEWLDEALDVPPHLLTDVESALMIEDALNRADAVGYEITRVFDRHFRPKRERDKQVKQELVRFKTLRERMQATFWERLAPEFRALIEACSPSADLPESALEHRWVNTLMTVAEQVFIATSEHVGDRADALRMRVEAQSDCRRQLYRKRKEWIGDQ